MSDFKNARSFNFKCNHTLRPAELWIGVEKDSHDVPIDDVGEHISFRNNLHLVPLTRFYYGFQRIRTGKNGEQRRLFSRFGGYHLSTPRDDATR